MSDEGYPIRWRRMLPALIFPAVTLVSFLIALNSTGITMTIAFTIVIFTLIFTMFIALDMFTNPAYFLDTKAEAKEENKK